MAQAPLTQSTPRPALTREGILRAALALVDARGLGALSMRQLGSALGVEAMSLYNHVANKEALVDGILDLVVGEMVLPEPGAPWRPAMEARALSAREAFRRHPWAPALLDSRTQSSPARLAYYEAILASLVAGGCTLAEAGRAFSLLDAYLYGFALQRSNLAAGGEPDDAARAAAFREAMPQADGPGSDPAATDGPGTFPFPHLAALAEETAREGYDEDADFAFGLGLILDALEAWLGRPRALASPQP